VDRHPPSTLWTARNKGRQIECIVRLLESGIDIEILITTRRTSAARSSRATKRSRSQPSSNGNGRKER